MTFRRTAAVAAGAAAVAVAASAAVLLGADGSDPTPREPVVGSGEVAIAQSSGTRPRGMVVDCSRRSEASFPGAFTDPSHLVVGPLVLMGGSYTPSSTVARFGGNKFPLLVKAGHTVTLQVATDFRRSAGLFYGRGGVLSQMRIPDTEHTITFIACEPGEPSDTYRPEGPSASDADGEQVTFWSGFVLTRAPGCVPLDVYIDDDPSPQRVGLALGPRCASEDSKGP